MKKHVRLDGQRIELLGQGVFIRQMALAGIEVAKPIRDCGVDFVIYTDKSTDGEFNAKPVQLKCCLEKKFSLYKKYANTKDLLIVHLWHVNDAEKAECYAMTYGEALKIFRRKKFTATRSWREAGGYRTTHFDSKMQELLEPHRMDARKWLDLLRS